MDRLNGEFYPSWKDVLRAGKDVVSAQECQSSLPAKGALRRKAKLHIYISNFMQKFRNF
jgi:hypothetical protein